VSVVDVASAVTVEQTVTERERLVSNYVTCFTSDYVL